MDIELVLKHMKEMLDDRGEDTIEFEEHGAAVPVPWYWMKLITLNTDKTTVIFALTKDLLKDLLKEWKDQELLELYPTTPNIILVLHDAPSSGNSTTFAGKDKKLLSEGGMFQVFLTKELMYNPSKHQLVPKHRKLSEEEAKHIMDMYMIRTKANLPLIQRTDPMAKWLGLRQGDIVEITRYNETSGEYFYYRCCV